MLYALEALRKRDTPCLLPSCGPHRLPRIDPARREAFPGPPGERRVSNASVHTLRHAFAIHILRKGTSMRVIQPALGHSSLQTTSVYSSLARELMDEQLQGNIL
jgi:integrase